MEARLSPLIGNDVRIFAVCCHILSRTVKDFDCQPELVIALAINKMTFCNVSAIRAIPASHLRPSPPILTI